MELEPPTCLGDAVPPADAGLTCGSQGCKSIQEPYGQLLHLRPHRLENTARAHGPEDPMEGRALSATLDPCPALMPSGPIRRSITCRTFTHDQPWPCQHIPPWE